MQAVTSFWLSQILGLAAQRSITEMRKKVQAHVVRLPIQYFDSTQTGNLVSRIMTDAEGLKNLDAVINSSPLQRFPLEQTGFLNASSHISVKYFSDFCISYRRGIWAGADGVA